MRVSSLVPLLAAFVTPAFLRAAEPLEPPPQPTPRADEEVVVTADRRETDAIRSTASVTQRQTQDDRERGYVLNTWQWLEGIAGVDAVGGYGGIDGGLGRVRIRGANSYDTQWLIDGIPVSDPSTPQGNLPTFALPSAGVDRVEVVRGPQSGLYGSRAVGGVVNLITARPTHEHHALVRAEAGSFGTVRGVAQATGPVRDGIGYALSVDGTHSDGYSAYTDSDAGGDPKNHERDGIDRLGATGRIEWQALPSTNLFIAGRYLALNEEFDNYNPDDRASYNKLRNSALSAGSRSLLTERLSVDIALSWIGSERTYHTSSDTVYDSAQYRAAVIARYQATAWLEAAVGADGVHESITITRAINETDRHDWLGGVWTQLYSAGEHHDVSLSLREDAQRHAGDATTWRIAGAAHAFEQRATLRAAIGTAFRAPSLSELYGFGGNTDLKAQESLGWEVGIRLKPVPPVAFESTYFLNDYDNVIDYIDPDGWLGPLGGYVNVPDYRVHGIENTLTIDLWERHLSLVGTYTWQEVQEVPDSDFDIYTIYLPRHLASVAVIGRSELGWARIGYTYRGTAPNGNGDEKLDAASVVDVAIGATITTTWEASVRVENLFDEHYEVNSGYTTTGLAIYGGVAARF